MVECFNIIDAMIEVKEENTPSLGVRNASSYDICHDVCGVLDMIAAECCADQYDIDIDDDTNEIIVRVLCQDVEKLKSSEYVNVLINKYPYVSVCRSCESASVTLPSVWND